MYWVKTTKNHFRQTNAQPYLLNVLNFDRQDLQDPPLGIMESKLKDVFTYVPFKIHLL